MVINSAKNSLFDDLIQINSFQKLSFFIRCTVSKLKIIFKVRFFEKKVLVWNFALPFFWGLQFYFQYIPFGNNSVVEKLFNLKLTLPLISYTLTGQFIWALFSNASLFGGLYFLYERMEGTLETLLLTPSPRTAIMLGSSLAGALNFCWFILFSLILIPIFQIKFYITSYFGVFFVFFLILISLISFGLFLQTMFIGTRIGGELATAIQEPLIFTSGMTFPIQYLPKILIFIGLSFPVSYSLFLLKSLLFFGMPLSAVKVPVLILIGITITLIILSKIMINLIENKMKNDASTTLF